MLTFLQFLREDPELERWLLHPKTGHSLTSPAKDKHGRDVLHWQMANKHDLPVGGPAFDKMERGGVHVERDLKGKIHRVHVNSYGHSGREAPVPYEVMRHMQGKYPGAEVYDHNKNMKFA